MRASNSASMKKRIRAHFLTKSHSLLYYLLSFLSFLFLGLDVGNFFSFFLRGVGVNFQRLRHTFLRVYSFVEIKTNAISVGCPVTVELLNDGYTSTAQGNQKSRAMVYIEIRNGICSLVSWVSHAKVGEPEMDT